MKSINDITSAEVNVLKLIVSDFDGVFTDNHVYTFEDGKEAVKSSKYDSIGVSQIKKTNIDIIVLSSEQNRTVSARCKKLDLRCYTSIKDKGSFLSKIITERGLNAEQVLYIGNDINDLPALDFVGVKVAVKNSHPNFIAACDFITEKNGGEGCIRELCDLLIERV